MVFLLQTAFEDTSVALWQSGALQRVAGEAARMVSDTTDALVERCKKHHDHCPDGTCTCDERFGEHTCPYQSDVNNDDEFTCTCCPHCEDECTANI